MASSKVKPSPLKEPLLRKAAAEKPSVHSDNLFSDNHDSTLKNLPLKPSPLKGKAYPKDRTKVIEGLDYFKAKDVAAAVAWLKNWFNTESPWPNDPLINDQIDAAFEDVTNES